MARTNRPQKDNLVDEFSDAYADAMAEVEKAAETTATDGWQQMYSAFMSANKDGRDRAAQEISSLAEALKARPLDGDGLKSLKAAVKDVSDLCESAAQFDQSTVAPIRGTVEKCQLLIADYESRSDSVSRDTPLTDGDLASRMADAISSVAKATWNASVGFIRIGEAKKV